jgi:UDP-3-O-[3-hydroxymyristoyl] glucosamine N-acyltransferase
MVLTAFYSGEMSMELPKEFTLFEIAALAGGKVGAGGETKVKRVAFSPVHAKEGDLALFFDPKLLPLLPQCKASAVLVPEGTECKLPHLTVKRPKLALQKMLSAVQPKRFIAEKGVHPTAFVDPTAQLAADVAVGPLAAIGPHTKVGARTKIGAGVLIGGKVTVGEDCEFHQGALVADYVQIGNRVILQQGASVGSDGFGYVTERVSNLELREHGPTSEPMSDEPNPLLKIPQTGTVILEDDVEVGSNSTIDRATIGATIVGQGTKIDNLVQIAHNNKIGRECLFVAGAAAGGSNTIGDRAVFAAQAATKDHLNIGKDAVLLAQTGCMEDIAPAAMVVGSPSVPARDKFLQVAHTKKLPQYARELRDLRKKMEQLEKALLERQLESTAKQ